ncbi:MAG: MBL fold metallo-hydrolase [Lachnospiraceae bacterium]|nr:MBL fold metallo-hydrolase [Lachnospiraceae bacterium]
MKNSDFTVTVLGARGSIPVCRAGFTEFGGATSCYMVYAGGELIFLDAGLGIAGARELPALPVSVLLSHPHLDHLLGLPFFPSLYEENRRVDLYARSREGLSAEEMIDGLYSPPYWPCRMSDLPAKLVCHDMEESFNIGGVKIDTLEVCHPGGSTAFRLSYGGKSLVYLTDYEQGKDPGQETIEFVRSADLLLCDAQYTEAELSGREGYGHSTRLRAMGLMKKAGAKELLFIHHDPEHDDAFLREAERDVGEEGVRYAREGEVIKL